MSSYIWIGRTHAKELAADRLAEISKGRKDAVKRFVERRLEELNKSPWRRWLGKKPLTYEEVEEMERSMPELWANTIWEIENWWYRDREILCNRILALGRESESVQLCLEDAEMLGA